MLARATRNCLFEVAEERVARGSAVVIVEEDIAILIAIKPRFKHPQNNNRSKQNVLFAPCGPRNACAMTNEGAVSASRGKRRLEGGRWYYKWRRTADIAILFVAIN